MFGGEMCIGESEEIRFCNEDFCLSNLIIFFYIYFFLNKLRFCIFFFLLKYYFKVFDF